VKGGSAGVCACQRSRRRRRIDLALEIALPDDDGRRRLLALYAKDITIDESTEHALVKRSAGVSGAFIKELARQAWLRGALEDRDAPTARSLAHRGGDPLDIARTLIALGGKRQSVWRQVYAGRKSWWALSHTPVVDHGLRNAYFAKRGLIFLVVAPKSPPLAPWE